MYRQVCFNLADDLRNMKGKGARLFAKRQAKSESWTVSGDAGDDDATTTTSDPAGEPSASIQQKLSARHRPEPASEQSAMPVNRLKEMTELPRPAMSPWEAAAKYGTVEPAFVHLNASTSVDSSTTSGPQGAAGADGGRVKSRTADPDPAASQ